MAFLAPVLGSIASGLIGKLLKFEDGGMVKVKKGKPTLAVVHGGERVLTAKQNKQYEKMAKEKGMKVSKSGGKKSMGKKGKKK